MVFKISKWAARPLGNIPRQVHKLHWAADKPLAGPLAAMICVLQASVRKHIERYRKWNWFWDVLGCFGMFWDVLGCFEMFWDVLGWWQKQAMHSAYLSSTASAVSPLGTPAQPLRCSWDVWWNVAWALVRRLECVGSWIESLVFGNIPTWQDCLSYAAWIRVFYVLQFQQLHLHEARKLVLVLWNHCSASATCKQIMWILCCHCQIKKFFLLTSWCLNLTWAEHRPLKPCASVLRHAQMDNLVVQEKPGNVLLMLHGHQMELFLANNPKGDVSWFRVRFANVKIKGVGELVQSLRLWQKLQYSIGLLNFSSSFQQKSSRKASRQCKRQAAWDKDTLAQEEWS